MRTSTQITTSKTTSTPSRSAYPPLVARSGAGFFAPAGVQMKMTVNQPGDQFEQEADRMADRVVKGSMPPAMTKGDLPPATPAARSADERILKKEEEKILRADAPEEKLQRVEASQGKLQRADSPPEKIQRAADDKIQKVPQQEGKLQRRVATDGASSSGAVGGDVQSAIRSKTTGGEQLSPDVRGHMESRFDADFSNIRIHKDSESASLNNQLSARAFTYQNHIFFSRDQYQPGNSAGQHLLAHELTHTIQQGHATQHNSQVSTTASTPAIQRLGIQDALDKFADWANAIPGFRMLTLVLGFNPISARSVDRTPANLLRALIELIPLGNLITRVLDAHGLTNKAAEWVQQRLATLGDIGSDLVAALRQFLDSLSWTDIFDLGGVWERAKRLFLGPIERLIDFGASLASELLQMVKEAILRPLANLAKGTGGYELLCVVLGRDPITGDPVARTAENLLGGFMKLIGQQEIWENIKRGNAIARAYAWFQGAMSGLMSLVLAIPGTIMATLSSLTFEDVITVVGAFARVAKTFVSIASSLIQWGLGTIWELLKIIVDAVKPSLMGYILGTGAALKSILKNPLPFMGHLINAAKLGFSSFAANIGSHLKQGLIDWLTGSLEGVYIPRAFSLLEFGKFAISILGVSWAQVRGKIVKAIGASGEKIMQGLEAAFDIIVLLVKGGPGAVWDLIQEKLSDLKDQVVSGIVDFVTSSIVQKAVPKLIAMFIPGAGFISALISIYDTVMVFVQKISKIIQVVTAFIDSIVTIAAGNIGAAARRVESIMGGLLSLAISFLAGFLGLGKVTDKIMAVVQKVRGAVDKALDTAVNWIVAKAKKLFARLFSKEKPDERTEEQKHQAKLAGLEEAESLVPAKDFREEDVRRKLAPIKSKHHLKRLDLVVDNKSDVDATFHFLASASNPETSKPRTEAVEEKTIGDLGLKRPNGWWESTKTYFLDDRIWTDKKVTPGTYKESEIDIRHKVSISDTIAATNSKLKGLKVEDAAKLLAEKKVGDRQFAPKDPKTKNGIIAAAREFIDAANNDRTNLFLGDARENRSLGKKYDGKWAAEQQVPKELNPEEKQRLIEEWQSQQRREYANKWGFQGTRFEVTLERHSKRRKTTELMDRIEV